MWNGSMPRLIIGAISLLAIGMMLNPKNIIKKGTNSSFYTNMIQIAVVVIAILGLILSITGLGFRTAKANTASLEDLVITMYTENPGKLDPKLLEFKNMFTEKGYVSIDSKNNILNIIDRYSKYSSSENKVEIIETIEGKDKVYIMFKIIDKNGNIEMRFGEFVDSKNGITDYREYTLGSVK